MSHAEKVEHTPLTPWTGGSRATLIAGGLGVVGCALVLGVAVLGDRAAAMHAWLFAYCYWLGLALGSLGWLMAFHAARARWVVVTRRLLENAASSIPVFLLLAIPLLVFMRSLYLWVDPHPELGYDMARLLEHKRPWLNPTFFIIRVGVYFAIWTALSEILRRWSLRQDETRAIALTANSWKLGAGGMPLHALAVSFAGVDWIMSLHPTWGSTMFGLYVISGNVVGACALWIVVTYLASRAGLLGGRLTPSHLHSQGKFLLAFTCFWAYVAFSQFMLVWIANLPEEAPWYLARAHGGWLPVALILLVGHFALPFAILLSREVKKKPRAIAAIAIWILVMHAVDVYWLILPHLDDQKPSPRWTELAAFIGIGGIAIAFGLWRARGKNVVPVGDPYLEESSRYSK